MRVLRLRRDATDSPGADHRQARARTLVGRSTSRQRTAAATAFAVLVAVVLTACGAETTSPAAGTFTPRTRGVLTVVTSEVPRPGFWEGTPARVRGGFEYELAKELAQRFGLKEVRVRTEPFDRIVAGHLDGSDLALDLITPTSERMQHLVFSFPYLDAAPTVMVRTGTSVPDLEDAQKLRWGGVRATTLVPIIHSLIHPNDPVRLYPTTAAMISALEHRQIDAALLDMPLAVATADRSGGRLDAAAQLPDPESLAAALPKGSSNVEAVDSAVNAMTADGTINRLLKTWVGAAAANAETSIPLLQTAL
jgi:polar amino acid transport system substrate-binding protein